MNDLIGSKRFLAAIASVVFILLKDKLPVTEQQVQDFLMIVAAWIVGDSLRGAGPVSNGGGKSGPSGFGRP